MSNHPDHAVYANQNGDVNQLMNPYNNMMEHQMPMDQQQQQQQQIPVHSPGGANADRNWAHHQNTGGQSLSNAGNPRQAQTNDAIHADNMRRAFKMPANMQAYSPQQLGAQQQQPVPIDYGGYSNFPAQVAGSNHQQGHPNNVFNGASGGGGALNSGKQHHQHPMNSQPSFNPVIMSHNSRSASEMMQVPLGYNTPQMSNSQSVQKQQQQQQVRAPSQFSSVDYNAGILESSPKVSLMMNSNSAAQMKQQLGKAGSQTSQQPPRQHQQQVGTNSNIHPGQEANAKANGNLSRRRRGLSNEDMSRQDEVMSSRYGGSDDEDDADSRPISVVSPDGRPTNSGRIRGFVSAGARDKTASIDNELDEGDRQVAQSQRTANHLDLNQDHDTSFYRPHLEQAPRGRGSSRVKQQSHQTLDYDQMDDKKQHRTNQQHLSPKRISGHREIRRNRKKSSKNALGKNINLDTADSGLMSKLLSTASTNDELEDDSDDDEDPASEKRKEELEDAEFGIVNDERQMRHSGQDAGQSGADSPPSSHHHESKQAITGNPDDSSSSGSTSSDANEPYTRKHQQRSDIEFYGHPGEETRQLKYGILGSGNYEVVNGGIYPEADESTAAVNSVANYVRKPGSILGGLPKLLANAGHSVNSVNEQPTAGYMPGGRMGGFLREASVNPNELVGNLMPESELGKDLSNPMLELIDTHGGQLFDPNILAHLGSSTRTTHTGKDEQGRDEEANRPAPNKGDRSKAAPLAVEGNSEYSYSKNDDDNVGEFPRKLSQSSHNNNKRPENEVDNNNDRSSMMKSRHQQQQLQHQPSSISGSRTQSNQFNSYQILPSKKVTIFSDQDLDSAPSGDYNQPIWLLPRQSLRQTAAH